MGKTDGNLAALARAEALLKATLDRESETHRRHDAKLEGLETMVRERDDAMALFHITEKTLKAKVDMLQGRLERISTEGSYTSKVLADEVLAEITK